VNVDNQDRRAIADLVRLLALSMSIGTVVLTVVLLIIVAFI
jgi:hypothetical protein